MRDPVDPATSRRMATIKSRDTKTELLLRRRLWRLGLRYKVHVKLPGKPDVCFPTERIVVFVDGDFWHGFNWRSLRPKLKNQFWIRKIRRNRERDREVDAALRKEGWSVVRLWEHQLKHTPDACAARIKRRVLRARGR